MSPSASGRFEAEELQLIEQLAVVAESPAVVLGLEQLAVFGGQAVKAAQSGKHRIGCPLVGTRRRFGAASRSG